MIEQLPLLCSTDTPLWAKVYFKYNFRFPYHRGKNRILHLLHSIGMRTGKPFAWTLRNGNVVAISPQEFLEFGSVGYTCFSTGHWEPHIDVIIQKLLKAGDTAIDIGANLGYFSAAMSKYVGEEGQVIAFEPMPPTFERLVFCTEVNGFTNVRPHCIALGAKEGGHLTMTFNPISPGNASVYADGVSKFDNKVDVKITTLDAFTEGLKLSKVHLIKMDVEGHELEVLKGAKSFLSSMSAYIIFEINKYKSQQAGWKPEQIFMCLVEYGYKYFYAIGNGGQLSLIQSSKMLQTNIASFDLPSEDFFDVLASKEAVG